MSPFVVAAPATPICTSPVARQAWPSVGRLLTAGFVGAAYFTQRAVAGPVYTSARSPMPLSTVDALLDPRVAATLQALPYPDQALACDFNASCSDLRDIKVAELIRCQSDLTLPPIALSDNACWQLQDDVAALANNATRNHVPLVPRNSFNAYETDSMVVWQDAFKRVNQEFDRIWHDYPIAVIAPTPKLLWAVGDLALRRSTWSKSTVFLTTELTGSASPAIRYEYCGLRLSRAPYDQEPCQDLSQLVGVADPLLSLLWLYYYATADSLLSAFSYLNVLYTAQDALRPTWLKLAEDPSARNAFVDAFCDPVDRQKIGAVMSSASNNLRLWQNTLRSFIKAFIHATQAADRDRIERLVAADNREGSDTLYAFVLAKYAAHIAQQVELANRQWPTLNKIVAVPHALVATLRKQFATPKLQRATLRHNEL